MCSRCWRGCATRPTGCYSRAADGRRCGKPSGTPASARRQRTTPTLRSLYRMDKAELQQEALEIGLEPGMATVAQLRVTLKLAREKAGLVRKKKDKDPELKGLSKKKKAELQALMVKRGLQPGNKNREEMICALRG